MFGFVSFGRFPSSLDRRTRLLLRTYAEQGVSAPKNWGMPSMPDLSYMELNLMQILDVLRAARLARLAVSERDQPYVVPLHYQLEVTRGQVIIHLTVPEGGRKADTLRRNALVCLEFELPGCAWVDTVVLEGRAAVGLREAGRAADIRVAAAAITGRRYFVPPE